MSDQKVSIVCPHCQKPVSLDDALTHQIQSKFKQDFDTQLQREKVSLWKIAQEKAFEKIQAQQGLETKLLKEELEEKRKALEIAQTAELDVRKLKNKLEEEKRNFELEKQRQLDAERDKIKNEVAKIISEEHQFKDAEKDKKMSDMIKQIEELKRKAQQGSQQLQGEVLELELEDLLKGEFPLDDITPVSKGIAGADLIHKVFDRNGKLCGTITWESKRTKAWSDGWIQKLKDDQRAAKAEVAILVSNILPSGITNFGPKEGIYICNYQSIVGVAYTLRAMIIKIATTKLANVGKNEKMEVVYNYLSSTEFQQRVETNVETLVNMKNDQEKEKRYFTKKWAKQDKQIQRLMDNTVGMHGDLQGLMGTAALPEIKSLELPYELEDIDQLPEE